MGERYLATAAIGVVATAAFWFIDRHRQRPGTATGTRTTTAASASKKKLPDGARVLLVYGASGPTGVEVTKLAVALGYRVRAFVRSRAKLEQALGGIANVWSNVEVIEGDLRDLDGVAAAVAGAYAVVSVAGSKPETEPGPMAAAVPAMVKAIRSAGGVRKLIVQAGALSSCPGEVWPMWGAGRLVHAILARVLKWMVIDDNDRVIACAPQLHACCKPQILR